MDKKKYQSGRRERRVQAGLPIRIRLVAEQGPQWRRALAIEVAARGVKVKAPVSMPPGETVEVAPMGSEKTVARGRIVWVKKFEPKTEAELGIEFDAPIAPQKWLAR